MESAVGGGADWAGRPSGLTTHDPIVAPAAGHHNHGTRVVRPARGSCGMHERTDAASPPAVASASFAAWAADIAALCAGVEALRPQAAAVGGRAVTETDWFGPLFGKLRPQVSREPLLVAAVCGGTNTGKSLITNALVGATVSRSVAEAARTRHPVACLPTGLTARMDPAPLFPGFVLQAWADADDPLAATDQELLLWREVPSDCRLPPRLVLLDTPDIDGTLRDNWERAELIRDVCDVMIAVLTQQKYNDALVREFFREAAVAGKAMIVIFNMLEWPRQRPLVAGWLATFAVETGVQPLAVYAAAHDAQAAAAGRIGFHPLPECCPGEVLPDPVAQLAEVDFARVKLQAMQGSLRIVLDAHDGLEGWLDDLTAHARRWETAQAVLADEGRVRVEMPPAPRELVWQEIWAWLEPRRSTLDLTVSRVYAGLGRGVRWIGTRVGLLSTAAQREEDFTASELQAMKQSLGDFLDHLDAACGENAEIEAALGDRLRNGDRAAWFADLERRHASLPIVSEGYRGFVRDELDRFARDNPDLVGWIVTGLNVGAVARPAVTVALWSAGAAAVPAAAATAGGITTLVHHVGDLVVGTAVTLVGEGALGYTVAGIKPLIERLFAGWAAERGRVLAETLQEVVLGDRLDEIERRAGVGSRPEIDSLRSILARCRRAIVGQEE